MAGFSIGGITVDAGSYGRTDLPVGRMSGGYDLKIPLHVVHGARPGPKLLLLGAIHGEEVFAVDVIREVLRSVPRDHLSGTVLAVPVANPPSLEGRTRNPPIDMLNLSQLFPGDPNGWITERIAAALSPVMRTADVIIDLDGGTAERVIHYMYVKKTDDRWGEQVTELSRVFGMELLYAGRFVEATVSSYAHSLGIPCVGAMIGGSLLYLDPRYLDEAVRGVFNVMRHLEMLPGAPVRPERQSLLTERVLLRVPHGGIFHPRVGVEVLNRPLKKGTVLCTVVDPYTLDEVGSLTAPYDASIPLQMRVLTSAVQPGEYAYIMANGATATAL